MAQCEGCGKTLEPSVRKRRYCPGSSTCRVKAFHARETVRRHVGMELLLAQTRAVIAGDVARLAAITREAERFLAA